MKHWTFGAVIGLISLAAQAVQPYVTAEKVGGGDLNAAMSAVEKKLVAGGFVVIGKHTPKGLSAGVVVVTDAGLLTALKGIGGSAMVAAPVRVGVKADGSVSYINPEYWLHGFVRKDYPKVEAAGKAAAEKLQQVLGAGKTYGGDVPADKLSEYRYMMGMPRFDSGTEIKEYTSHEQAVQVVRENLAKGVGQTTKVYELLVPEKGVAVFGFAQNNPETGEGIWINKISGVDHIAAMPWEVFVIGKTTHSLQGRFRTALAWPSLTMGQFMTISQHPGHVREMAEAIVGY